jgi:hypothetical protein
MKKTTKPQSKLLKETHLEYQVDSGHAGRKRAATKTGITIPEAVFESAQKLARKMNMSLSEFYTVALTSYIAGQQAGDVTEALNHVYQTERSELDSVLINVQLASLAGERW